MERKFSAKKAEKICSQGSAAFKAQIAKRESVKRIKKKIQQKKYSFKKRG